MLQEWLNDIEFANPRMLTLLAFIPFMTWWYVAKGKSSTAAMKMSTVHSFTRKTAGNLTRHFPFILRMLAVACVVVALARPQKFNTIQNSRGEGIDIVLSLDVSGSMLSKDFLPNRLEVMKELAADFIRNRPVDRIALVIFSGESFTLSPLTTDKNTLISQVQSLRSGMLRDGTLIGEGLATAADRLSESKSPSKVIILLTDGKEEAPETRLIDPLTALEIAKSKGVKVYTIGMSGHSIAAVEENVRGARVTTDLLLDEPLLRRIASETRGQYFRARDKLSMQNIYQQIDQLEKSEIEITTNTRKEEKFIPLLMAALGLLFLEILLRFTVLRKFP